MYAIDHRLSCFDVRNDLTVKNLEKYYEKVENFLDNLF